MIRIIINKFTHPLNPIKRLWYTHWNICKLLLLGAKVDKGSSIKGKVYIHIGEKAIVSIGRGYTVNSGDNINPLCSNTYCSIKVEDNATLKIGDWSGMSGGCLWATDSITIGNHVNIGANCIIMDGDIHNPDWKLRQIECTSDTTVSYKHKPIVIEDNVWLGANTIVLKGVTIGARTIIGAGSVVTKDIPADCIAAGNPCCVIKSTGGAIHNTYLHAA